MGIYHRYATALLIPLALFSSSADAATRKTVSHGQTDRNIISTGSTTGGFQTPAGQAAFFGQDYVDEHTAGNRFNAGDNPGGASSKQKVTVKPVATVSKAKTAKKAVQVLRASVPGAAVMAAQAAVVWAVDQIPDAEWDGYQLTKKASAEQPARMWTMLPNYCNYKATPQGVLDCYVAAFNGAPGNASAGFFWRSNSLRQDSATAYTGFYDTKVPKNYPSDPEPQWQLKSGSILITAGDVCVDGSGASRPCAPGGNPVPFQEADYQQLEDSLAQVNNSEWLRDLIKASCDNATNPEGCYNDLVAQRKLLGPAMQMGPKYSTTTTTTNPDGSTSTTTTTSQNRYDYSYGGDSYDFSTTTKTDTTKDGQTSSTETTDAQPEGETPSEEQQPEEQEPEYTFNDSELPEITPFYEQKYPDGFEGVWNSAKADFESSEFVSFMNSFVPSFSGTCPSWSMNFAIGALANFGTIPFQSLCYIFDFIKIIMLVTALFTCRAIIFGG